MKSLIIIALSYTNALAAICINFYLMSTLSLVQFGYWSYTNSAAGILGIACSFGLPKYLMSCVSKTDRSLSREFTIGAIASLIVVMILSPLLPTQSTNLLIVLSVSFIINEYSYIVAQTSQSTRLISIALLTSTFTRCSLLFLFIYSSNSTDDIFSLITHAVSIQLLFQFLCYILILINQKNTFSIMDKKLFSEYSPQKNIQYLITGLTSNASNHFIIFITSMNSTLLGAEINIFILITNIITLLPGSLFTRLIDYRYQVRFERSQFKFRDELNKTIALYIIGFSLAILGLKSFFLIAAQLKIDVGNIINVNIIILTMFIAVRFSQFPFSSLMNVQSNIKYKNIILLAYIGAFSTLSIILENLTLTMIICILLTLECLKILAYATWLAIAR